MYFQVFVIAFKTYLEKAPMSLNQMSQVQQFKKCLNWKLQIF